MKVELKLDLLENNKIQTKKPLKETDGEFKKIINEKLDSKKDIENKEFKENTPIVEKPTLGTKDNIEELKDNKEVELINILEEPLIKEDILNVHNLILELIKDFKSLENMEFNKEDVESKISKISENLNSLLEGLTDENLNLLKGEEVRGFNFTKLDKMVNEIKVNLKEVNKIARDALESIISKAMPNIPTDKSAIKNRDVLEKQLIYIEKAFGKEKTKTVRELIEKLETLGGKIKGIENLNEINKPKEEFLNKKPMDLMIKTEETSKIAIKKEESVLKEILNEGQENRDKTDFSMFNKRLEALKETAKNEEAPVLRKGNLTNDLVKSVKYMNTNGIKELTVKVYPRDLGEIIITVSKDEGLVKANIKANSKETFNILSQNAVDIKKLLGESNIKISNVDISLYEDTTFYNESEFNKEGYREQGREKNFENREMVFEELEEDEDNKGILDYLV